MRRARSTASTIRSQAAQHQHAVVSDGLRVLVVSPYPPSRLAGGPIRLHGLVTSLPAPHRVSLIAFARRGQDDVPAEIRERCDDVVIVPNERRDIAGPNKRALQLRSLLTPRSFERLVHERPAFQAAIDQMIGRSAFDVIQIEHCFMAHYRFPRSAALVLDEHNIEHEIRARTLAVVAPGPRKAYDYLNHLKLRAEEGSWRDADACAATSPLDEETIRRRFPEVRTAVVPNAVDTSFFSPGSSPRDPRTMLFYGTLSYFPNLDGLLFFLREVMPIVRRMSPEVRLRIVGASPPDALRRFEAPDVTFTGFVPDLRVELERAGVVIAPLRIGGGTRLKVLEAMAMAAPLVSTTLGAEGLSVTNGRELLLADTAQRFASDIVRVLRDKDLGTELGRAGRHLVETSYDWRASARALEALYRETLASRRPVPALRPVATPH
jgi:glycosyltransferase involved in cell wall biosynthesis